MLPLVSCLFLSSLPSNLNPIYLQHLTKEGKSCTRHHHSPGDRDRLKLDQTNKTIPDKSLSSLNWILKSYGSIWNFIAIQGALLTQVPATWGQNPVKHRQVSGVSPNSDITVSPNAPGLSSAHHQKSFRLLLSNSQNCSPAQKMYCWTSEQSHYARKWEWIILIVCLSAAFWLSFFCTNTSPSAISCACAPFCSLFCLG